MRTNREIRGGLLILTVCVCVAASYVTAAHSQMRTVSFVIPLPIEPHAIDAVGHHAWVVGPPKHRRFGPGEAIELTVGSPRPQRLFAVGDYPVSITDAYGSPWVGNGQSDLGRPSRGANTVWRLTRPIQKIRLTSPSALAQGRRGLWVLVAGGGVSSLRLISPRSNSVAASIPIRGGSALPQFAVGEGAVWVPTIANGTGGGGGIRTFLTRVSDDLSHRVSRVAINGTLTAVAVGEHSVWATAVIKREKPSAVLLRIDPRTGDRRVVATLPAARALSYANGVLWVVTSRATIVGINGSSGAQIRVLHTRGPITGLSASGAELWAFDQYGATVTVITP